MGTDTAPCVECHRHIPTGAVRCPECGYSPIDKGSTGRTLFKIVGASLCATVVGAVLGVPMILLAQYIEKAKERRGAVGG